MTLYTITVDTEEEWDWATGWPVHNLSVENLRELPRFQELCARHGASVTYFTNHAVFENPAAREILLDVAARPDVEIGMHIHPWNTPPLAGNAPTARESFLHNLPPDLIRAKLDTVYNSFREHGLEPTSFRGGRYSSGGPVHDFLFEKGFRAEASVVPYTTWPDEGAPDYRHRDLYPRRLASRNPGQPSLWEVPLTLAFTRRPFGFWRRAFGLVENSPLRHLRLIGIAERLGLVRRVWLSFEAPLGENMLPFLRQLRGMNLPAVCFSLHSSSLMAGGNGFTPDAAARERLFAYVDEVLAEISTWSDFQPATVTAVADHLEAAYQAQHSPASRTPHAAANATPRQPATAQR